MKEYRVDLPDGKYTAVEQLGTINIMLPDNRYYYLELDAPKEIPADIFSVVVKNKKVLI